MVITNFLIPKRDKKQTNKITLFRLQSVGVHPTTPTILGDRGVPCHFCTP